MIWRTCWKFRNNASRSEEKLNKINDNIPDLRRSRCGGQTGLRTALPARKIRSETFPAEFEMKKSDHKQADGW
jgi:hypothetical protein